jgi:hypothetical protein
MRFYLESDHRAVNVKLLSGRVGPLPYSVDDLQDGNRGAQAKILSGKTGAFSCCEGLEERKRENREHIRSQSGSRLKAHKKNAHFANFLRLLFEGAVEVGPVDPIA